MCVIKYVNCIFQFGIFRVFSDFVHMVVNWVKKTEGYNLMWSTFQF